jgi:hypothetical protein
VSEPGLYICPHCGEEVDTSPDPGGGLVQQYVEDCPVCCRPNMIYATYSPDEDAFYVEVSAEI